MPRRPLRLTVRARPEINLACRAGEAIDLLDLAQGQLGDLLQMIRRSIVDMASVRARTQYQLVQLQQGCARFDQQARKALAADRGDLARVALACKSATDRQVHILQALVESLAREEALMQAGERQFAASSDAFRDMNDAIRARSADGRRSPGGAVQDIAREIADITAAIRRTDDRIAQLHAQARGLGEPPSMRVLADLFRADADDIQAQLDAIAVSRTVDAELAALKANMAEEARGQGRKDAPAPPDTAPKGASE